MIKLLILLIVLLIAYVLVRSNIQNAVLILMSDSNVLLVKDKQKSEWQFPGGIIDPTDASPLNAALREFREETEHELVDYKIMDTFDYRQTRLFIATSKDQISDSLLNNTEMNERKWFNINNMPRLRQSNENSFAVLKQLTARE